MTNEEAIDLLKSDIHTEVPRSAIGARRHNEAVLAAVEALEKQIPKKPKLNFGDCIAFPTAECTVCGRILCGYKIYCSCCGQAINWSEVKNV